MRRGEMVATFETAADLAARARRRDGRAQGDPQGRQGRGASRRGRAGGARAHGAATIAASRGSTMSRSRCAQARSSASPASPATASPNCSRRWRACGRWRPARFWLNGAPLAARRAQSARDARAWRRPCAGGPPSRRPRHAVRGLRERDARLPRRAGLRRGRAVRPQGDRRRRGARRWRPTTSARARRC